MDSIDIILKKYNSAPFNLDKIDIISLLCFILQCRKEYLIMYPNTLLNEEQKNLMHEYCIKRKNDYPIAYITKQKEFYSLNFNVTPDVLVPRPETEILVDLALSKISKDSNILELGTGSGIISICLAVYSKFTVKILATDISPQALNIAKNNALLHQNLYKRNNIKLNFKLSNWFSHIEANNNKFDIIISNPPYIRADDQHLNTGIRFEPIQALTDGSNGLNCLNNIVSNAKFFLKSNGYIMLEHGYDQAQDMKNMLEYHKYTNIFHIQDLSGHTRATCAQYAY